MNKFICRVRSAGVYAAFVLTACIVFSSCLKDKNNDAGTNTPAAGLMVFNLAADKSAVGFSIDGNSLTNVSLGYQSYNGGYAGIYPGQRMIDVYDFYSPSGTIASATGAFENGKYYSAFLIGVDTNYRNIIVPDNFDSLTATAGKSFLRYINAIPDSLSVPDVSITATGSGAITNPAPFGTVSTFAVVNTGDINVAIKNNNGINANRTFPVVERKLYTVLLTGIPGSATTPVEIKYIENGTLDSTSKAAGTTGIGGAVIK